MRYNYTANPRRLKWLPSAALLILLAGCGVSVDSAPKTDDPGACVLLSGDDLTASFRTTGTCLDCSAANTEAVIDGDPTTFATLSLTAMEGEAALRVSSASGSIVPAREVAVKLRSHFGLHASYIQFLRTFLGFQDRSEYGEETLFPPADASIPADFEMRMETGPFDTVEFAFGRTAVGYQYELDVFDFCFIPE